MNAKIYSTRLTLAGMMLLFILACTISTSQPVSAPVQAKTKTFAPPSTKSYPSATLRPVNTTTRTPTKNPTRTPTLPPLPDFDEVISFGGGGGMGDQCDYSGTPNKITAEVEYGDYARFCMMLNKMNLNQPFWLTLTQTNGSINLSSKKLWVNGEKRFLEWEGYSFGGDADWTSDGTLFLDIYMSWPVTFMPGEWQISITQGQFHATHSFWVTSEPGKAYINALDRNADNVLLPSVASMALQPQNNEIVRVSGVGYPPNSIVYVVLYQEFSNYSTYDYRIVQKQAVQSDGYGSINVELAAEFSPGQAYVVYGITNPNVVLGQTVRGLCNPNETVPCNFFQIASATAVSSSSCPGAPPQRMIVNQRGYVCTQSDRVHLRNAPAKSADTILYLPTGMQFFVVSGPSCADNWSWWNVRLDDGMTGWLSEGGDEVDPYFICPLP